MRKELTLIIVVLLALLSLAITTKADQNNETKVEVYVITEEDLVAYFNGSSTDGSVSYYIEGIEVLTELQNINTLIGDIQLTEEQNTASLSDDLQILCQQLQNNIDNIYACVVGNIERIGQNNRSIEKLKEDLLIFKDNLYMLRDEVVSFENSYFENISRINTIFDELNEKLVLHESLIEENRQNISELQEKFDDLSSNLANVGGTGSIFLLVFISFYIFNKRHPFAKVLEGNFISKNFQHKLLDFTKKQKSKTSRYKRNVKINKNKSPLKSLFSFFHVNK